MAEAKKRKRGPYGKRNYEQEHKELNLIQCEEIYEMRQASAAENSNTDQTAQNQQNECNTEVEMNELRNENTVIYAEEYHKDEKEDHHISLKITENAKHSLQSQTIDVDTEDDPQMAGENCLGITLDDVIVHDLQTYDADIDEIFKSLAEKEECLETTNCYDELTVEDTDADLLMDEEVPSEDHDNDPLYPGSPVTIGAFMLLLAVFTTKYNLVGDATQQLLNIIAMVLPNGHKLCTTLHEFKKYFRNLRNPLVHHYYCNYCKGLVEDISLKTCPFDFCKKPFDSKTASYFIEIPLKNQIQNFLRQENFFKNLQHRFTRDIQEGHLEDIYDGRLYQSFYKNGGILSNPNNISFTFNTDGAPVFKSSKISVWPIFLVINELPYKLRMKRENMILTSLWFGSEKPSMGTFLKPFQKTMKELYSGIECETPENGNIICRGILLCGTADLPARSLLCNHNQYNGAFSCWKCEQEGETAKVGKGHARVFPFKTENSSGPVRTKGEVLRNARMAVEMQNDGKTNHNVKGIKGPSWLLFFPTFDIVSGVAIDYMHGVLLGVMKMLMELWFQAKYSKEKFSIKDKLEIVDERLLKVCPTLDITRLPRSIQDLKYWKASEYRSFLLFFGAPVLHDMLDKERFTHFLLLVNSMHILLKCGSTLNEIDNAEIMLTRFCKYFENLYGKAFMRLNVHQLLHLPECVRSLGPLYTHSCFSFEDKNGVLLKMIRGTQNIDSQIVTGVSFLQKLPELKENCLLKGSECEQIYNSIESVTPLKRTTKLGEGVYVLGKMKEVILTENEIKALSTYLGYHPLTNKVHSFKRIELGDAIIYGLEYGRMIKRDNSTIEFKNSQNVCFGNVLHFILVENEILAIVRVLNAVNFDDKVNILTVKKCEDLQVVNVFKIVSLCMLVSYEGTQKHFLCRFPNRMESD